MHLHLVVREFFLPFLLVLLVLLLTAIVVITQLDGGVSRAVAFEGLLHNGERLAERLVNASIPTGLALIATDGESYGHHHGHVCK